MRIINSILDAMGFVPKVKDGTVIQKEKGSHKKGKTFLVLNRVVTPDGTVLTSYNRFDRRGYIDAQGRRTATNGGLHELIREGDYREASVWSNAPFEVIRESYHKGIRLEAENDLVWTALKDITDFQLSVILSGLPDRSGLMELNSIGKFFHEELEYRRIKKIQVK